MAENNKNPKDDIEAELLLKDADDALRQDQLKALWDEWGSTIIGMALMIIFGTMIGVGWQSWQYKLHTSQTSALIQSSDDLSGQYLGIKNMINAGQVAAANDPSMMYDLMNKASDSGLPREWDILAEWGKLRAVADIQGNDKIKIANDMVTLSKKRNNPYAPAILMEAAILKGETGDTQSSLSLLNEAKNHDLTIQNQPLNDKINNLIHLYSIEVKS